VIFDVYWIAARPGAAAGSDRIVFMKATIVV